MPNTIRNKTLTITGFVTKVDWVNPHAFVFIDCKDESGVIKSYRLKWARPML